MLQFSLGLSKGRYEGKHKKVLFLNCSKNKATIYFQTLGWNQSYFIFSTSLLPFQDRPFISVILDFNTLGMPLLNNSYQ